MPYSVWLLWLEVGEPSSGLHIPMAVMMVMMASFQILKPGLIGGWDIPLRTLKPLGPLFMTQSALSRALTAQK